jgi:Matrixin
VSGKLSSGFFTPISSACAFVFLVCALSASLLEAEPVGLAWPQPGGPGAPIYLTYSYSNLLDGTFFLLSPADLRAGTEEAFRLWASSAPLNFIEVPDAGPAVSDLAYSSAPSDPRIRIGQHQSADLAHAFYPGDDGLAGDVHVASGVPWTLGENNWNFLEAITHELGHALGLGHELDEPAIMNPSYPFHRFAGLGTGFLFPSDIRAIQSIYGAGTGSVQPLDPTPEPTTCLLVSAGVLALGFSPRRRTRAATI